MPGGASWILGVGSQSFDQRARASGSPLGFLALIVRLVIEIIMTCTLPHCREPVKGTVLHFAAALSTRPAYSSIENGSVQTNSSALVPLEHITRAILILRGHKVLLDTEETTSLRSQFATLEAGRGQHRKYLPYAFTEHGAIMAATILNSPGAVEMSVYVVRAFVKLRELLTSNRELARRFAQLETRLDKRLTEHDQAITAILSAIRELMNPPQPKRRPIGFTADLGHLK